MYEIYPSIPPSLFKCVMWLTTMHRTASFFGAKQYLDAKGFGWLLEHDEGSEEDTAEVSLLYFPLSPPVWQFCIVAEAYILVGRSWTSIPVRYFTKYDVYCCLSGLIAR